MTGNLYICGIMTETISIHKNIVYDEVAKTTSYTGAKMIDSDTKAYLRIFTTDEDRLMLERFWCEACNVATDLLKPFLSGVEVPSNDGYHEISESNDYIMVLELPSNYSTAILPSMTNSLINFFVSSIIGKWYKFTNKEESETYLAEAAKMLEDVRRKLYHRSKPTRIKPTL